MITAIIETFAFSFHTLLIIGHLFGLLLGLGCASILFAYLMRTAFVPLHPETIKTFHFISHFVTAGLVILWITGIAFLVEYSYVSPEKLQNEKIYAKMTIVAILTINGFFVHTYVLNRFIRPGAILVRLRYNKKALCFFFAVTSGVSWYAAFFLGVIKEYNFKVGYELLVIGYLFVWFSIFIASLIYLSYLQSYLRSLRPQRRVRRHPHPQTYFHPNHQVYHPHISTQPRMPYHVAQNTTPNISQNIH